MKPWRIDHRLDAMNALIASRYNAPRAKQRERVQRLTHTHTHPFLQHSGVNSITLTLHTLLQLQDRVCLSSDWITHETGASHTLVDAALLSVMMRHCACAAVWTVVARPGSVELDVLIMRHTVIIQHGRPFPPREKTNHA